MSESATHQSDPPTLNELVMGLHEKQRALLSAIATAPPDLTGVEPNADGPPTVRTTFLTSATEYSNNTVGHHTKHLIRTGLVERVEADETPHSPGRLTPNAYRCTEKGLAAADIADAPAVGDSLEALHLKIEQLTRKNEALEDEIDEIKTQHDALIDRVNERL